VAVAKLKKPGTGVESPYLELVELARRGKARLGAANRADLYPALAPALPEGEAARLLDEERGERWTSTRNRAR
jgi:hypothetical protein